MDTDLKKKNKQKQLWSEHVNPDRYMDPSLTDLL